MSTVINQTEQSPIFAEIIGRLDSSLSYYENLSDAINSKANKLLLNKENPDVPVKNNLNQQEIAEKAPSTIIEILTHYNDRFAKINDSLNNTLIHLNRII